MQDVINETQMVGEICAVYVPKDSKLKSYNYE